jgi:hypothetical protein
VPLRVGPVVAVLLLAAATGCSGASPLGEYEAARTLHLAPDGRLVVTDLGSGRHDGAVVAVDVASGRRTVLMRDLPSTRDSGQGHADLAGPSGAAMAADGTVCAAIGDATTRNAGFATRPPAAVVSLPPDAAARPGRVEPTLLALLPHPIALAPAPGGLAVVDYGGAPGERGRGELRLVAGVGTAAAAGTRSPQPAGPHRLLASGLDGPTGVARLPDGRWAAAESGHTSLTVLTT